VDAKTDLEKVPINAKNVHVQVCRFKSLKGLLPKPYNNIKHWKVAKKSWTKDGKILDSGAITKKTTCKYIN
jgi:hypothetical protein